MLGQVAMISLVTFEVGVSIYSLNKNGFFDGIKDKVSGYTNKVKSSYYEGRHPEMYQAWLKQQKVIQS